MLQILVAGKVPSNRLKLICMTFDAGEEDDKLCLLPWGGKLCQMGRNQGGDPGLDRQAHAYRGRERNR